MVCSSNESQSVWVGEVKARGGTFVAAQPSLSRVSVDPVVCGGMPFIRGTRIPIAVILDGLAEGLTQEQLFDHFPQLSADDVQAALAYAAELSRETIWKLPVTDEAEAR
jgi:uncharacterized protein (DUF433 family)